MTNKLDEKIIEPETNPATRSNPVDELARIIGYDNRQTDQSSAPDAAFEPDIDLEAELMREFNAVSAPTAPEAFAANSVGSVEPAVVDKAQVSEPQEPVLSPQDNADFRAQPEMVTQPQEQNFPEGEAAPQHYVKPSEQEVKPQVDSQNFDDDVLSEMARYDVPQYEVESAQVANPEPSVKTDIQGQPESILSPESNLPQAEPQVIEPAELGGFANELDKTLTELQMGLTQDFVPQATPVLPPQSVSVSEPSTDVGAPVAGHFDGMAEASFETPVSSEADIARGLSSQLPPEDFVGEPESSLRNSPQESKQQNSFEDRIVDMSQIVDPSTDVEEVVNFDIPELPEGTDTRLSEGDLEMGLDLELEREFSQLLSDEAVDASHDQMGSAPSENSEKVADEIDEISSLFNLQSSDADPDREHQPTPAVLTRPERIDVTDDADDTVPIADARNSERNVMQLAVVGVLAAIVVAGGAFLLLRDGDVTVSDLNEPVIIQADNSPIKEIPEDPGGASVPNQDQAVYDQVEGNDVTIANQSTLVEGKEEPVDIVQQTLNPDILPRNITDGATEEKSEDRLVANLQDSPADAVGSDQALITPRKVRTVIVQPDGTIITRELPEDSGASSDAPAVSEGQSVPNAGNAQSGDTQSGISGQTSGEVNGSNVATVPTPGPSSSPVPVETAANQESNSNSALSGGNSSSGAASSSTAQETPSAQTAPVEVASVPAVSAPTANFSGYYMQIASQPSLEAAQSTYQSLSRRFSSLLGGRGVEYQKATIEGKGVFHRVRIQVGTRGEANALCSRYKSAGGSCFVAK